MSDIKYLVDLISDKHIELRAKFEQSLQSQLPIDLNSSEIYLIHLIGQEEKTGSQLSKNLHVTRQAIHKIINRLELEDLVVKKSRPDNDKDKYIFLTKKGVKVHQAICIAKKSFDDDIEKLLGKNIFDQIKASFSRDWSI